MREDGHEKKSAKTWFLKTFWERTAGHVDGGGGLVRAGALAQPLVVTAFSSPHPCMPSPASLPGGRKGAHMDDKIWSRLPNELVERVLAKLPVSNLLQLRSTCKAWNSLITSPSFLHLYQHSERPPAATQPFFVFHTVVAGLEAMAAYNPTFSRWHQILLPFLPTADRYALIASAGGLFCFCSIDSYSSALYVCNPIFNGRKAFCKLPCLPHRRPLGPPFLAGMSVDRLSKSYTIVIADRNFCEDRLTDIYTSATGCWSYGGKLPRGLVGYEDELGVFVNGTHLYGMARLPNRVIEYDVANGVWGELPLPVPRFVVEPHLVERQGQLLMIGGVDNCWERGLHYSKGSIRIWQLDQKKKVERKWVEVDTMPKPICKAFLHKVNFEEFRCVGQGDLLYFTSGGSASTAVLLYDFATRSWQWLPPFPSFVDHMFKSYSDEIGVFTPTLDSIVH